MMQALGLIEVVGYPAVIEAADAALKAANVQLGGLSKVGSGIMTVQLFGDVGAITAAVEAGGRAAEKLGKVRSAHVIPRVDESLIGTIIKGTLASSDIEDNNQSLLEAGELVNEGSKETGNSSGIQESNQVSSDENSLGIQDISLDDDIGNQGEALDTTTNSNLASPDHEEVVSIEDLNKKSNMELRKLIETLGIKVPDKKLKEAKKAELIRLITDSKK